MTVCNMIMQFWISEKKKYISFLISETLAAAQSISSQQKKHTSIDNSVSIENVMCTGVFSNNKA